jgi:hypothetical protein
MFPSMKQVISHSLYGIKDANSIRGLGAIGLNQPLNRCASSFYLTTWWIPQEVSNSLLILFGYCDEPWGSIG